MRTTTGTRARTRRRLGLTGLAGVALFALTACGGSAPRSAGAAATSAQAAGSTGTSASASSASSAGSSAASSGASGASGRTPSAADLTRRVASAIKSKSTAHLGMTSATGQSATGVLRFSGSGVDFSMSVGLPGGKTMQMVVVRGTAYMNVGEKYQGKDWIRIVPGGSDPLSKALGPMLAQLGTGLDLNTQLAGVKDAKITDVAGGTLAGVQVTKYTLVSTEKALQARVDKFATTPQLRDALRAQFKGAHGESVMWLGNDDLPLRVDSRVVGGRAPASTTSVTYTDWGKPVSIVAPPAADTVNLAG